MPSAGSTPDRAAATAAPSELGDDDLTKPGGASALDESVTASWTAVGLTNSPAGF
jgi:hypothetical protein